MKPLHAFGSIRIAGGRLPGPSAIVRIADESGLLAPIKDQENAIATLDCTFADTDGAPTAADAKAIYEFARVANKNPKVEHIVAQCQAGVGRSVAVCAALSKIAGKHWENMAVYNRTLYKLILAEAGLAPDPEPAVTIAVRVKYGPECLMGFMLSLQRQRYSNWHAVAYTDGPRPDIRQLASLFDGNQLTLIETAEQLGHWGHPYRQLAFDHCKGEWLGTNNDDNYLTPGYIEQMIRAGERTGAKLVLCSGAHRYSGWGICPPGSDLACWLAHRSLVEQVRWEGNDFLADQTYLQKLMNVAGSRVAEVPRVLVVKN